MSHAALKLATERACAGLLRRGWMVATAESCTGGLIAEQLTTIGGSSVWFERGFVTYSNAAKVEMLGVSAAIIEAHGAVSSETAQAMVLGALEYSRADVAIAVTGIAGPSGGTADKPVGTVWFGFCVRGEAVATHLLRFEGDRRAIREAAAAFALAQLAELTAEAAPNLA